MIPTYLIPIRKNRPWTETERPGLQISFSFCQTILFLLPSFEQTLSRLLFITVNKEFFQSRNLPNMLMWTHNGPSILFLMRMQ